MKVDVFKEIQSPFIINRIIKTEYTGEKQQCLKIKTRVTCTCSMYRLSSTQSCDLAPTSI